MSIRRQLRRFTNLRPAQAESASAVGLGEAFTHGALLGLAANQISRLNSPEAPGDPSLALNNQSLVAEGLERPVGWAEGPPSLAVYELSRQAEGLLERLSGYIASSSSLGSQDTGRLPYQLVDARGPPISEVSVAALGSALPESATPPITPLEALFGLSGLEMGRVSEMDPAVGSMLNGADLGEVKAGNDQTDWLEWEGWGRAPSHSAGGVLLPESLSPSFEVDLDSGPLALLSPTETAPGTPGTKTTKQRGQEGSKEESEEGLGDWLGIDLNNPPGFEVAVGLPDTEIASVDPESIGLSGILPAASVGGGGSSGGSVVDPGVGTDAGGGTIDTGGGGTVTPPDTGGGGTVTPPDTGGGGTVTPPDTGGGGTVTPPDTGGGGTTPPPSTGGDVVATPFAGRVVDGAVQGAQVFVDYNQDSIWDSATEPVATTDADGFYSFAAGTDTTSGPIVSIGGTDVETGVTIQTLKAEAGSPYVTPVSTLYVVAEQLSPGSGESLLASMSLSAEDLAYDPIASTDPNSLEVLKLGASVMSVVTSAVALTSQYTGETQSQAMESAFKAIVQSDSGTIGDLFGGSSGDAATVMGAVFERAIANSGASVSLDDDDRALFTQAATLTAARTAAIALTTDKSVAALESMYQDAELALKNLSSRFSELAVKKANGESISDALNSLSTEFNEEAISSAKATIQLRRVLEKANADSGIRTSSDTLSIDAPTQEGASVKTFDLLANDQVTGFDKSQLTLVSVGLFNNLGADRGLVQSIDSATLTLEIANANSWSKVEKGLEAGKGLRIDVLTPEGVFGATISGVASVEGSSSLKSVTLVDDGSLDGLEVADVQAAAYVITEALPSNLDLEITEDGRLQVTNAYSADNEFGSTNLIYIVAEEGNPERAASGFATLNVLPKAPQLSLEEDFGSSLSRIVAQESDQRDEEGGPGVTQVGLELWVTGLGLQGAIELRGAPANSELYLAGEAQTPIASGVWLIKVAGLTDHMVGDRLEGLTLEVPGDYSGEQSLKVIATSRYAGLASKTIETYTLSIEASPDGMNAVTLASLGEAPLQDAIALKEVQEGFLSEPLFVTAGGTDPFGGFMTSLKAAILDKDSATPERLAIKVSVQDAGILLGVDPTLAFVGQVEGGVGYFFDPPAGTTGLAAVEKVLSGLTLSTTQANQDFAGPALYTIEVGSFESADLLPLLEGGTLGDPEGAWEAIVPSPVALPQATVVVQPVSDTPTLSEVSLTLGTDQATGTPEGAWSQVNHRLSDGRYSTQVSFTAASADEDGSEALFIDVLAFDLRQAGSSLDLAGTTAASTVVESDDAAGRSLLLNTLGSSTLQGSARALVEQSGTEARVSFSDLPAGKSVTLAGKTLTASSLMTGHEVAEYFASQTLQDWTVDGGTVSVWRRFDAEASGGSFNVLSPSTISAGLPIHIRAVARDSVEVDGVSLVAADAESSVSLFTIPFKEVPKPPVLAVIPSLSVWEDSQAKPFVGQDFVLSGVVKVEPAAGRTLDSVSLYVELGLKVGVDPSLGLVSRGVDGQSAALSPLTTGIPSGMTGTVYKVPASALSSLAIRASENSQSTVTLRVIAEDASASGDTARTSIAPGELLVKPYADGIVSDIDPGPVALPIGVETSISDWFEKLATVDGGEDFSARLLFKGLTSSGSVLLRLDGEVVLPTESASQTASKVDLTFNLTHDQLMSLRSESPSDLTAVVKPEVAGKEVVLAASSVDGIQVSALRTQVIDLTVSGEAVEPDGALFDVSGDEDTNIFIPSNISLNPDRLGFERVGITARVTDPEIALKVQGGTFGIGDGLGVSDVLFSVGEGGVWTIFEEAEQIDLGKLFFRAPLDFSGEIPFELTPFSKTLGSDSVVSADPSPIVVSVIAVPETLAFAHASHELSLTGSENARINLPLDTVLNWGGITDQDERVNLGIRVADDIAIERLTAGSYKAMAPVSVVDGVASYTVSVSVANWQSELQGVYRLTPALNYASDDPGGSVNNALAAGLGLSVTATSIESTGAFNRLPSPLLIDLEIDPVAGSAPGVGYVSPGVTQVTLSEAQPTSGESFSPYSLVRLASSVLADSSESLWVRVELSDVDHDRLRFYSSSSVAVNAPDFTLREGSSGSWEVVTSGGNLLTPGQYKSMVVRGTGYEYGTVSMGIQSVVTESWGGSSSQGSEAGLGVVLTPRANGFSAAPSIAANPEIVVPEDASQFASLATVGGRIQSGTAADAAESVRYLVSVPEATTSGEGLLRLKWVGSGSAPVLATPTVSVVDSTRYLTYDLGANQVGGYTVVGAKNFSGDGLALKVQAYTQTPPAAGTPTISAPVTVGDIPVSITPVADLPTLIQPGVVSGLITDPALDAVAVPVQVYKNDPSEVLSVSIVVATARTDVKSSDDFVLKIGAKTLTSTGTAGGGFVYAVDSSDIANLSDLTISSAKDFRGDEAINLTVNATSTDGSSKATQPKTSLVTLYQSLEGETVGLDALNVQRDSSWAQTKITFGAESGLGVSLPAHPAGVLENLIILVSNVPEDAFFTNTRSESIGASLGDGLGLWVFRGTEFFDEAGTRVFINGDLWEEDGKGAVVLKGAPIEIKLILSDPDSGSSVSTTPISLTAATLEDYAGTDSAFLADPLVLSVDGSPIKSLEVVTPFGFDLSSELAGEESPLYWIDNTGSDSYAFILKPGFEGESPRISDLIIDFDELRSLMPEASFEDGVLSLAEILDATGGQAPRLWFDRPGEGLGRIESDETFELGGQDFPDFYIQLPESSVDGQESAEGLVSLYKAPVAQTADGEASSMIYAMGIPFTAASEALPQEAPAAASFFSAAPEALVTVAAAEVPEDNQGAVSFVVSLNRAVLDDAYKAADVIHLLKVYVDGLPPGAILSRGTFIEPEGADPFWLMTEDAVGRPVSVMDLPEDWVGAITFKAQAVATMSLLDPDPTLSVFETLPQSLPTQPNASVTVEGVADTPLVTSSVTETITLDKTGDTLLEGGAFGLGGHILLDAEENRLSNFYDTEDLFVRLYVQSPGGYALKSLSDDAPLVWSAPGNFPGAEAPGSDEYVLPYLTDGTPTLAGLYIDFDDFVSGTGSINYELVSVQGQTSAWSQPVEVLFALESVVSPIESLNAAVALAGSATSGTSSYLEGQELQVFLEAGTRDPNEFLTYQLLIGEIGESASNAASQALQTVAGMVELTGEDKTSSLQSGLGGTPVGDYWRVFEFESELNDAGLLGDNGAYSNAYALDMVWDPFFDGEVAYLLRARATDSLSGKQGDYLTIAQTAFTFDPTAEAALWDALIETPYVRIQKEGLVSESFSVVLSQQDPDEEASIDFVVYESDSMFTFGEGGLDVGGVGIRRWSMAEEGRPFDLLIETPPEGADGAYSFEASGADPTKFYAAVLELTVSESDSGDTREFLGSPVMIEVPSFAQAVSLQGEDGGPIALTSRLEGGDPIGFDVLGINGLSSLDLASLLGEAADFQNIATQLAAKNIEITYTLSGVPLWMVIEGGTFVGEEQAGSVYEFSPSQLLEAGVFFERNFSLTTESTSLDWSVRNVDLASFDSETSGVVSYTLDKLPLAEEPIVTGPSQLTMMEGASIALDGFDVMLPGFMASVAQEDLATLEASIEILISGLTASQEVRVEGELRTAVDGVYTLSLEDLALATIQTADQDDTTAFSFDVQARQVLGTDTSKNEALSETFSVGVEILNEPEDVTLGLKNSGDITDVIAVQEGTADEEGRFDLPDFRIVGGSVGEGLRMTLQMPSSFVLRDAGEASVAPLEIVAQAGMPDMAVFELYTQPLTGFELQGVDFLVPLPYTIGLPAGTQLGRSDLILQAQSYDPLSGAVGGVDSFSIALDVQPRADDPTLLAPERVESVEDSGGVAVSLAAFSPDPRESVRLVAEIYQNGQQMSASDGWQIQSQYLDLGSDGSGGHWEFSVPEGFYDPIEVIVFTPDDFYNAERNQESDLSFITGESLVLEVSAWSVYSSTETVNGEEVTTEWVSDTPQTVSMDILVDGVNDAPRVDETDEGNVLEASISESDGLASGSFTVLDPDFSDTLVLERSVVGQDFGSDRTVDLVGFSYTLDSQRELPVSTDVLEAVFDPAKGFEVTLADPALAGEGWSVDWSLKTDTPLTDEGEAGIVSGTFEFLGEGETLNLAFDVNVTDRPEGDPEHGGFNNSVQQTIAIGVAGENDRPEFMLAAPSETQARLFLGAVTVDPVSGQALAYEVLNEGSGVMESHVDNRLLADGILSLIEKDITDSTFIASRIGALSSYFGKESSSATQFITDVDFNSYLHLREGGVLGSQANAGEGTLERQIRDFQWEFLATEDQFSQWGLHPGETLLLSFEIGISDREAEDLFGGAYVDLQPVSIEIVVPDIEVYSDPLYFESGASEFDRPFVKDNLSLTFGLEENLKDEDVQDVLITVSQAPDGPNDTEVILRETHTLLDTPPFDDEAMVAVGEESFDLAQMLTDPGQSGFSMTQPIDVDVSVVLEDSEGKTQVYTETTSFTLLPDVERLLESSDHYDPNYEAALFGDRFDAEQPDPSPSSNFLGQGDATTWSMIDPQFGSEVLSSDESIDGAEIAGENLAGTQGDDLLSAQPRSYATGEGSVMYGGQGSDTLLGNEGQDILIASLESDGVDTLDGGYGNDVFLIHKDGDIVLDGMASDRFLDSDMDAALDTLAGGKDWSVTAVIDGFSYEGTSNTDSIVVSGFEETASVVVEDLGEGLGTALLIEETDFISAILLPDTIVVGEEEASAIKSNVHSI
jgi:hypothetical protein